MKGGSLWSVGVGEINDEYKSGTAEILSSSHSNGEVDKIKSRKSSRRFKGWQEVRNAHSTVEVCESRRRKGAYALQLRLILCHADNGALRNMIAELAGIQRNIDKADRTDRKVQNLASYINKDSLKSAYKSMDGRKVAGIGRVTKDECGVSQETNLEELVARMKRGAYHPHPSRKVYIPKDGKGKMRPLGISSFEDKLVEAVVAVVAEILTQIYAPKIYGFS